jgi:GT2 family glycosyltransferase
MKSTGADTVQAEVGAARVCVVVLNWNGWKDTIECLESLFRLDYPNYFVVVVDNGSTDGSVEQIRKWASGQLPLDITLVPDSLRHLVTPPCRKPIPVEATVNGQRTCTGQQRQDQSQLVIIESGRNLGYAGGNNIGIDYALGQCADFVWILNNDTVVEPSALGLLVERFQQGERVGLVGATIRDYWPPHSVQCLGGARFDSTTAREARIGMGETGPAVDVVTVEHQLSYISGACVLVSRQFLEKVGLMNEDYFLFYEELDWALRARVWFGCGLAAGALVYHKEGAKSGSRVVSGHYRSPVAEYWLTRSLVLLYRRYFRDSMSRVLGARIRDGLYYVRRGKLLNVLAIARGFAAGARATLKTASLHVLYLMYIPWFWIQQRPQFLAMALARLGLQVTAVSPAPWRRSMVVGGQSFSGTTVRYRFLPFRFKSRVVYAVNRVVLRRQFAWILRRHPRDVLWVPFPELMEYLPEQLSGIVVYDCMDDALAFDQLAAQQTRLRELEQRLVARADVILVSSDNLVSKLGQRYHVEGKVGVVRNGFGGAVSPAPAQTTCQSESMGYFGNVDTLDVQAMRLVLSVLPQLSFHLIGPFAVSSALASHPRVRCEGALAHDRLAAAVSADVCMVMPYVLTERVQSADSMKLYDYINLGKPIVSVWYPEIERFRPFVEFYRTPEEFVSVLRRLIATGFPRKYTEEQRLAFLEENSWDKRAQQVNAVLTAALARQRNGPVVDD